MALDLMALSASALSAVVARLTRAGMSRRHHPAPQDDRPSPAAPTVSGQVTFGAVNRSGDVNQVIGDLTIDRSGRGRAGEHGRR